MKFEAHITFDTQYAKQVQEFSDSIKDGKWSYSIIDGDPLLGPSKKCYLSAYSEDSKQLLKAMDELVFIASLRGFPAMRQKVEMIIYDTKTKYDIINNK